MTGRRLAVPLLAPAGLPLAIALAIVPLLAGGPGARVLTIVAAVAVVAYAAGVGLPWPALLPWAIGLLAAEYLAGLLLRQAPPDAAAPAYAAALFVCAEMGWIGIEARTGARPWLGRGIAIAGVALAGAAIGSVLLLAASLPVPGGGPLTALGVVAAITASACVAWLARR